MLLPRTDNRLPRALRRGVLSLVDWESTRSVMACSRERAEVPAERAEPSPRFWGLPSVRVAADAPKSSRGIFRPIDDIVAP